MTLTPDAYSAPRQPGVYVMKDAAEKIVYIGKAKELKKRVDSYFRPNAELAPKTLEQIQVVTSIDFVITNSEYEALVLEANLIREHRPRYNVELKDNTRYQYIRITDEAFPRLVSIRHPKPGARGKLLGPFVQGAARAIALRTVQNTLGLRTCNPFPKRACLKYHLGQCSAPCIGKISKVEYAECVQQGVGLLTTKREELAEEIERQMKSAAAVENFERAKTLRDELYAFSNLPSEQAVDKPAGWDEDVIGLWDNGEKTSVFVFNVVRGVVRDQQRFSFANGLENSLEGFLREYYAARVVPDRLLLSHYPSKEVIGWLVRKGERPVRISVPVSGAGRDLLDLAEKNAKRELESKLSVPVAELQSDLRLPKPPCIIECFDISTLFGQNQVASMVQFVDGERNSNAYRHFKIKGVEGQNDFASMREVVFRRYSRLKDEGAVMPDLIVVDGGASQLKAAHEALQELNLYEQPVIGLAKQNEEIYLLNRKTPLVLDKKKASLKLLQRTRDEAHRFAIQFHRKLRGKAMMKEFEEAEET